MGGCGFLTEAKVSLYLTLSIFPVNVTDTCMVRYLNLNLNGLLLTRKIDNTLSNQLFVSDNGSQCTCILFRSFEVRRSKDFLVTTLDN